MLKKLFTEFDINKNGFLSTYEVDLLAKRLELPVKSKVVEPMMKILDKNQSGYVEFD